jgi:hypothetical protein
LHDPADDRLFVAEGPVMVRPRREPRHLGVSFITVSPTTLSQ